MTDKLRRLNCWEYKNCGREPGGARGDDLGFCPAAVDQDADGLNFGTCGGRICWAISGTYCRGNVQGVFVSKITSCSTCDFFRLVEREEGDFLAGMLEYFRVKQGRP